MFCFPGLSPNHGLSPTDARTSVWNFGPHCQRIHIKQLFLMPSVLLSSISERIRGQIVSGQMEQWEKQAGYTQ